MPGAEGKRLSELIAPAFACVHRDILTGGHAEYWLKGGRGSTKSSFVSIEIVLGILRDPAANAIIYRKVAATLRESVYAQMLKAIDWLGVGQYFRARVSPMELVYTPTGQRILFHGADDPSKSKSIALRSGYFKFLWFEELSEFAGPDDIRTIKASVIRGGGRAVTLSSYNPPITAASWVNKAALIPKRGRLVHSSTYLDVPREWLGEAFIAEAEALRDMDERAYRHVYLGEVTGTGGQVFENLSVREIPDTEIATFGAVYAGLDFGWFPDPAHFCRCAFDPARRRLYVFDEFRTVKTPNEALAWALLSRVGARAEIVADSSEPKSVADMGAAGLNCVGATKGPGSVEASVKWLQGLREIVIDPARCPAAAKEFTEYEYARDRDGNPVSVYPDKNNHAIDAVRYALNRVWLQRGM